MAHAAQGLLIGGQILEARGGASGVVLRQERAPIAQLKLPSCARHLREI